MAARFVPMVRLQAATERRRAEELQHDRDLVLSVMPAPPLRRWFTFARPLVEPPRVNLPGTVDWDAPPGDPIADFRAVSSQSFAPSVLQDLFFHSLFKSMSMRDWMRDCEPKPRGRR